MRHLPLGFSCWALGALACAAPIEQQDNAELVVVGAPGSQSGESGGGTGVAVGSGGAESLPGSGGAATGGAATGGSLATGGSASGGTSSGGTSSGGTSSGGTSSGGTSSGGTSSGGTSSGGTSSGGTSSGGTGSGGTSGVVCNPLAAGAHDVTEQWWSGDSEGTDGAPAHNGRGMADPTGIPGLDMWGPTGWANLTYAFGPSSECRDASGLSTITVDVTSVTAGPMRVSLMTSASQASSNHYTLYETFTANETKTLVLNLDGSNLASSWAPADAVWDPEHLISIIAIPLATDANGLAPYDVQMSNIVVE